MVRNPPVMRETWVRPLGWEDALEEGMATLQYSCLKNPHGQRSLAGSSPWVAKTDQLNTAQHNTTICDSYEDVHKLLFRISPETYL